MKNKTQNINISTYSFWKVKKGKKVSVSKNRLRKLFKKLTTESI